jgi:hypothetical protein
MRFWTTATLRIVFVACLLPAPVRSEAGERPAPLAVKAPQPAAARFPTSRQRADSSQPPMTAPSASWWLLPLGLLLAGGAWAGLTLSARKSASTRTRPAVPLEVVGRVAVGPRQAVCLVKVGAQVLIVGTGPQGPPTLMGELEQPAPQEAPQ